MQIQATHPTGYVATIKVDEANNRMSDIEIIAGEERTVVIYDYISNVEIVAPEGAIDFEIPDLNLNSLTQ